MSNDQRYEEFSWDTERKLRGRIEALEAEVAAAREEGRRAGLEEAAKVARNCFLIVAPESVSQRVGAESVRSAIANTIETLIDKPADPVAEAARVLLNDIRVTTMFCAAMFAGEDPPKSYADADAWVCKTLRAIAQKEGE